MLLNVKNLRHHLKHNKKEIILFLIDIESESIKSMSENDLFLISDSHSKDDLGKTRLLFWEQVLEDEDLSFKIISSFLKDFKYEIKINCLN